MATKARARTDPDGHGPSTHVLLVDEQPIVRLGLRHLLESRGDIEVCGETGDASEVLQLIQLRHPDLIILDLTLQGGSGIELIKQIRSAGHQVRLLVFAGHDESIYAERALRAGANGYLTKQAPLERLLKAIEQIAAGQIALSVTVSNQMLQRMVGSPGARATSAVDRLSDRELEVFDLIGQGLTTRQIAQRLHLSPKTIETHREKIKQKLGVANVPQLVRHAVQWAMEDREPSSDIEG